MFQVAKKKKKKGTSPANSNLCIEKTPKTYKIG